MTVEIINSPRTARAVREGVQKCAVILSSVTDASLPVLLMLLPLLHLFLLVFVFHKICVNL